MSRYVIVDLEMCKIPKDRRKSTSGIGSETIQIGAVLLNDTYEIIDEFNVYIQPEFGSMDLFIMNLTGIGYDKIKDAPLMGEAIKSFLEWIPEGAKLVSWSESDLKQIRKETKAKNIEEERLEEILGNWLDCQKMFSEKIEDQKVYNLAEALIAADIIQEGQEHDGLVDARNTAKLFAKMMREPKLKLNAYFEKARFGEKKTFSYSLGDVWSKFKFDD